MQPDKIITPPLPVVCHMSKVTTNRQSQQTVTTLVTIVLIAAFKKKFKLGQLLMLVSRLTGARLTEPCNEASRVGSETRPADDLVDERPITGTLRWRALRRQQDLNVRWHNWTLAAGLGPPGWSFSSKERALATRWPLSRDISLIRKQRCQVSFKKIKKNRKNREKKRERERERARKKKSKHRREGERKYRRPAHWPKKEVEREIPPTSQIVSQRENGIHRGEV